MPRILRAAAWRLTTLAEHYGVPQDQSVADVTWITDATALGWVALLKDEAIATNVAEKAVVQAVGARLFCLARKDLPAGEMAGWLLSAGPDMELACGATAPPFIYAVERDGLRRLL